MFIFVSKWLGELISVAVHGRLVCVWGGGGRGRAGEGGGATHTVVGGGLRQTRNLRSLY